VLKPLVPKNTHETNISSLQETLTYGCICGGGIKPNITEYTLTLPYFTCTEWGTQCTKACGQDNACSANCLQNNTCGANPPPNKNQTSSTMTSSATASASATQSNQVFNGLNGATSTPSGTNAASRMLESGSTFMFAAILGGIALGAGLV